jgi:hypothetical protein
MSSKKYSPDKLFFDIKKVKSAWDSKIKITAVVLSDNHGADDIGFYNTSGLPKYFELGVTCECLWEFELEMFDQVKNDLTLSGFKYKKMRDW